MSVGSPILSPTFAPLDSEEFSYLSDNSKTSGYSMSHETEYADENATALPYNRYTFTPTRIKPQPRAWERKPSTPFAPRSEAQKIWKRVPLQIVTSSINASWRKDSTKEDGVMRPVKRLRLGAVNDSRDKENLNYVTVKWDVDAYPETSPRRRAPAIYQDPAEAARTPSPAEKSSACPTTTPGDEPIVESPKPQETMSEAVSTSEEDLKPLELMGFSEPDQDVQRQSRPESGDDGCAAAQQLLDEADVFLRFAPEASPSSPVAISFEVARPPMNADSIDLHERMSPALGDPNTPVKTQTPGVFPVSEARSDTPQQPQPLPSVAQNDPDDTSYLQDFLLRSRAQRAARVQPTPAFDEEAKPESTSHAEMDVHDGESNSSSTMSTFDTETAPSPPTGSGNDIDVDVETEAKASSPCRRSNRLTRLPRPQKPSTALPNSIALRRLNGTEFISMQREAQSLAVTTRTNTRKNKGVAIAVPARLLQLQSEILQPVEECDESGKGGKSVAWAEILARFQDYNGPELTPSPEVEAQPQQPESTQEVEVAVAEPEQKKSSKRVRKLRKESVGSVNGTPAPKRSIEILLADAARTTGQIGTSNTGAGKRTRSKTKG